VSSTAAHLVVAAYEVHVLRVLDLERQQQADGLQRVRPPVHIVTCGTAGRVRQSLSLCHRGVDPTDMRSLSIDSSGKPARRAALLQQRALHFTRNKALWSIVCEGLGAPRNR